MIFHETVLPNGEPVKAVAPNAADTSNSYAGNRDASCILSYSLLGLVGLFLAQTYGPFLISTFDNESVAHIPFVFAIMIGLLVARFDAFSPPSPEQHRQSTNERLISLAVIIVGIVGTSVAHIESINILQSTMPLLLIFGVISSLIGLKFITQCRNVLWLSIFLIAWPGWIIDSITLPLKLLIAQIVSQFLFVAGLPVTHSGSIIHVGNYELLVADACAGVNTAIALMSIGAVYIQLIGTRPSYVRWTIGASLLPIAIFANLIRVTILVLITWFFGYDAGQSFLHEASGLLMFALALLSVFTLDHLLSTYNTRINITRNNIPRLTHPIGVASMPLRSVRLSSILTIFIFIVANIGIAIADNSPKSTDIRLARHDLNALLPATVGNWEKIPINQIVLPFEPPESNITNVAYAAYRDPLGRVITLVLAYGPPASDNLRLHRPETCYRGQGFTIQSAPASRLETGEKTFIPLTHLNTQRSWRQEAVTYWFRAGNDYARRPQDHQWINFKAGFGRSVDGMLVRFSSTGNGETEFTVHRNFAENWLSSLDRKAKALAITQSE